MRIIAEWYSFYFLANTFQETPVSLKFLIAYSGFLGKCEQLLDYVTLSLQKYEGEPVSLRHLGSCDLFGAVRRRPTVSRFYVAHMFSNFYSRIPGTHIVIKLALQRD